MEKILKIYKNLGETPLECLERFRAENTEYKNLPMTYAGRLDPMAEGLLIILVGEECKKKDEYLGLDKEYVFEVLFGVETDTYDILGIPKVCEPKSFDVNNFLGRHTQEYPAYSSRTFQMARDGIDFEPPTKEIEIYKIDEEGWREISTEEILLEISRRIDLVRGDFRQEEIKNVWRELLDGSKENFVIRKFKINCSSGTYVRSICNEIGGIAWSILRTKVGEFKI